MSKVKQTLLWILGGLLLLVSQCDFMVTGHMTEQENAVKAQKAELEAKMNAEDRAKEVSRSRP
jgi:hypothetical protein